MDDFQVDFEKVQFVGDSRDWLFRIFHYAGRLVAMVTNTTIFPRVVIRGFRKWLYVAGLPGLGTSLGFNDATSNNTLDVHEKRIQNYLFLLILIVALLMVPILRAVDSLTNSLLYIYLPFYLLILFIISVLITFTIFKFAFFILERYFADTLCIVSVFAILFELTLDDVLQNPYKKRVLLKYVNDLARNTMLLSVSFIPTTQGNVDIKKHFQKMKDFIRERETWIVLPKENTLDHLRRDYYLLAKIYLSGRFGQFDWDNNPEPQAPEKISSLRQRVLLGMTRVLGIVLPIILWLLLMNNPSFLANLGIDTNTFALLLIIWLLVSLDTILNLGITSTIIAIFKEFKELK